MKNILSIILITGLLITGTNELSAQRNMGYHAYSYDGGFRVPNNLKSYARNKASNKNNARVISFRQTRPTKSANKRYALEKTINKKPSHDKKPSCGKAASCSSKSKKPCCKNNTSCQKRSCKAKSNCSGQNKCCNSSKKHNPWDYSDHSDLRDVPNLGRKGHSRANSRNACSTGKSSCSSKSFSNGAKKACCKDKASCAKKACAKAKTACKPGCKKACCSVRAKDVQKCPKGCTKACCKKRPNKSRYNRY